MSLFALLLAAQIAPAERFMFGESLDKIPESAVDPDSYHVGPGDILEISMTGMVTYTSKMTINLEGRLSLMGPGVNRNTIGKSFSTEGEGEISFEVEASGAVLTTLSLKGLTLKQAVDSITTTYDRYYHNIDIRVSLSKAREFQTLVTGNIFLPGSYRCSSLERASSAIVKAGGIKPGGSFSRILLIDTKSDSILDTLDLYRFLIDGNLTVNPFLREGVRLHVQDAEATIHVKGAVAGNPYAVVPQKPKSRHEYNHYYAEQEEGDDVAAILKKVGGLLQDADPGRMYLLRQGEQLAAALDSGVKSGDELYVPELPDYVTVGGEVRASGWYPFEPNQTLLYYINQAGGISLRGKTDGFTVVHWDGTKERLKGGVIANRGDNIRVDRVSFMWWEDYLRVTAAVTAIFVTWLTISR